MMVESDMGYNNEGSERDTSDNKPLYIEARVTF